MQEKQEECEIKHLFSFLFSIFADNMQILLASAKIMNDKVNVLPDLTLSIPAFRKEAESFARDMAQYSTETIAEMLGCSHQINDLKMQAVWAKTCRGAMARFIIENRITIPKHLNTFCYEGFTYNPALG